MAMPTPADLVGDPSSNPVVRARALSKLTAAWPGLRRRLTAERDAAFDAQLTELLGTWRAHEDLKATSPSIADQSASRTKLDQQRLATALKRCA